MTSFFAAILIWLIVNVALFLWLTSPPRRHPPSSVTPQRRMF